jgi:hypothetical protein
VGAVEGIHADGVTAEVDQERKVPPVWPQLQLTAVGEAGAAHDQPPIVLGRVGDVGFAFSRYETIDDAQVAQTRRLTRTRLLDIALATVHLGAMSP